MRVIRSLIYGYLGAILAGLLVAVVGLAAGLSEEVIAAASVPTGVVFGVVGLSLVWWRPLAERVRAECDRRLTDAAGALAAPLVTPTAEEQALNASAERRPAEETETQVARALDAFAAGAFLLLVDDRQVESAEEPVRLSDGTVVTFLRLTPLVGG